MIVSRFDRYMPIHCLPVTRGGPVDQRSLWLKQSRSFHGVDCLDFYIIRSTMVYSPWIVRVSLGQSGTTRSTWKNPRSSNWTRAGQIGHCWSKLFQVSPIIHTSKRVYNTVQFWYADTWTLFAVTGLVHCVGILFVRSMEGNSNIYVQWK